MNFINLKNNIIYYKILIPYDITYLVSYNSQCHAMARTRHTAQNTYRNMQIIILLTSEGFWQGITETTASPQSFTPSVYRWLEGTAKTGLPHCDVAQLLNECFLGLVAAATLWVVIVRRIGWLLWLGVAQQVEVMGVVCAFLARDVHAWEVFSKPIAATGLVLVLSPPPESKDGISTVWMWTKSSQAVRFTSKRACLQQIQIETKPSFCFLLGTSVCGGRECTRITRWDCRQPSGPLLSNHV